MVGFSHFFKGFQFQSTKVVNWWFGLVIWVILSFQCCFDPQKLRLRRFLRVNKIEEGLSHRITRFLHYTYHQRLVGLEPLIP